MDWVCLVYCILSVLGFYQVIRVIIGFMRLFSYFCTSIANQVYSINMAPIRSAIAHILSQTVRDQVYIMSSGEQCARVQANLQFELRDGTP
jgi:hypothetical protein